MATKQLAMVIDLQKCVGCGACALACKTENNTQGRTKKQTFNWADYDIRTEGKFPNVKYVNRPVLCNHCDNPKCLEGCPEPRALYKTEEGITMYNQRFCIQCGKCYGANGCPYSSADTKKEGTGYTVISFNDVGKETHGFYRGKKALIEGVTSSPEGIAKDAGAFPPRKHEYEFKDRKAPAEGQKSRGKGKLADVRKDGWVEKCTFCIHRVRNGSDPYCVVSCPAKARIFGDRNDPGSDVSKLLKKHKAMKLKNNKGEVLASGEEGTSPNVYYIKDYKKA
jgi:Fe-S-cluster-containing dehydrogenase component